MTSEYSHEQDIPDIFLTRRDYRSDPTAVEDGHSTTTEAHLYDAIAQRFLHEYQRLVRPLVVADVCCATGGASFRCSEGAPYKELHLVDIEPRMLKAAAAKNWSCARITCHNANAVSWRLGKPVDLFLANSAYHHIPDEHKADFLSNLRGQLCKDGSILVGEHFLPEYDRGDLQTYRRSVFAFYSHRIRFLEDSGDAESIVDVIRQTGYYCWIREYEFQVSQSVFLEHCEHAGLSVSFKERLWPKGNALPASSGTFIVVLRKAEKSG